MGFKINIPKIASSVSAGGSLNVPGIGSVSIPDASSVVNQIKSKIPNADDLMSQAMNQMPDVESLISLSKGEIPGVDELQSQIMNEVPDIKTLMDGISF